MSDYSINNAKNAKNCKCLSKFAEKGFLTFSPIFHMEFYIKFKILRKTQNENLDFNQVHYANGIPWKVNATYNKHNPTKNTCLCFDHRKNSLQKTVFENQPSHTTNFFLTLCNSYERLRMKWNKSNKKLVIKLSSCFKFPKLALELAFTKSITSGFKCPQIKSPCKSLQPVVSRAKNQLAPRITMHIGPETNPQNCHSKSLYTLLWCARKNPS